MPPKRRRASASNTVEAAPVSLKKKDWWHVKESSFRRAVYASLSSAARDIVAVEGRFVATIATTFIDWPPRETGRTEPRNPMVELRERERVVLAIHTWNADR